MQLLGRHGEVPQITELCLLGPVTRPGAAGAQKAILATRRRSLQMVLRLLAAAEPWLGNRLDDYRALGLLIEEINAAPPCMPGDTRPITYQLATHPRI